MGFLGDFFGETVSWGDVDNSIRNTPNQLGKKWITVYFSIYFKKHPNDTGAIENTVIDITSIINNTHSLFSENGDFLGCVNPYLHINTIFSEYSNQRPHLKRDLNKPFKCFIRETPDQYQLVIHPVKENSNEIDLYPLETLCYDMYILGHASDYISQRYQITVQTSQSSYNPEIIDEVTGFGKNIPFLTHFIRLLVYRYPVMERFEFQKEKPKLDTWLFGAGKDTFYDQIDVIRKSQPNSEWTKKVNEIIGDTKK
jgi:hypothetical protein